MTEQPPSRPSRPSRAAQRRRRTRQRLIWLTAILLTAITAGSLIIVFADDQPAKDAPTAGTAMPSTESHPCGNDLPFRYTANEPGKQDERAMGKPILSDEEKRQSKPNRQALVAQRFVEWLCGTQYRGMDPKGLMAVLAATDPNFDPNQPLPSKQELARLGSDLQSRIVWSRTRVDPLMLDGNEYLLGAAGTGKQITFRAYQPAASTTNLCAAIFVRPQGNPEGKPLPIVLNLDNGFQPAGTSEDFHESVFRR
ncbi:hypothetical protein JNJ66_04700 [Candidatus Saccharibacteria bacterium]|nr:hypothetical protein [Candidatus Saccharibacteria bacterium]